MSTQIKGLIKSEVVVISHQEPGLITNVGNVVSGATAHVTLTFKNDSNIPQNLVMDFLGDFVNCSALGTPRFKLESGDETPNPNEIEVLPKKICTYNIEIKVSDTPIGSPDLNFSFNADWTWS